MPKKRFKYLLKFISPEFKLIVRAIKFMRTNKIKPIDNSVAEKINKKNVNASKFKLSNHNPVNNEIKYNVTHSNSVVNNKFNMELVLTHTLNNNKIKKQTNMFKSPTIIKVINLKFLI